MSISHKGSEGKALDLKGQVENVLAVAGTDQDSGHVLARKRICHLPPDRKCIVQYLPRIDSGALPGTSWFLGVGHVRYEITVKFAHVIKVNMYSYNRYLREGFSEKYLALYVIVENGVLVIIVNYTLHIQAQI